MRDPDVQQHCLDPRHLFCCGKFDSSGGTGLVVVATECVAAEGEGGGEDGKEDGRREGVERGKDGGEREGRGRERGQKMRVREGKDGRVEKGEGGKGVGMPGFVGGVIREYVNH